LAFVSRRLLRGSNNIIAALPLWTQRAGPAAQRFYAEAIETVGKMQRRHKQTGRRMRRPVSPDLSRNQ